MTVEKNLKMAEKIAELVAEKGGRVYCVGGCVRDKISGVPIKDIDCEVHGISRESLEEILDSERARAIFEGFSRRQAVEELCRKCGYARRFRR